MAQRSQGLPAEDGRASASHGHDGQDDGNIRYSGHRLGGKIDSSSSHSARGGIEGEHHQPADGHNRATPGDDHPIASCLGISSPLGPKDAGGPGLLADTGAFPIRTEHLHCGLTRYRRRLPCVLSAPSHATGPARFQPPSHATGTVAFAPMPASMPSLTPCPDAVQDRCLGPGWTR